MKTRLKSEAISHVKAGLLFCHHHHSYHLSLKSQYSPPPFISPKNQFLSFFTLTTLLSPILDLPSHSSSMAETTLTRDQYLYLAKLAEQAERYEEMVKYMDNLVVSSSGKLSVEERNLLSVAYKNVIGSLRAAWRIVSSIEQKEESRKNEDHVPLVKSYRSKVESELSSVCASIFKLLDSHLLPSASGTESKVFYLKMKGDYHRYLAEFLVGDERKNAAEETMIAYKAAQVYFLLFCFFA